MDHKEIIKRLITNQNVFAELLSHKTKAEYIWKPDNNSWCLLEVVCHLYDEEREDFRTRVQCTLESPERTLPGIDPVSWVTDRKYIEQDYDVMVASFLSERKKSTDWLLLFV